MYVLKLTMREGSFIKAHTGDPVHGLGTNLLKVTIGLSALVFIIMLQVVKNVVESLS